MRTEFFIYALIYMSNAVIGHDEPIKALLGSEPAACRQWQDLLFPLGECACSKDFDTVSFAKSRPWKINSPGSAEQPVEPGSLIFIALSAFCSESYSCTKTRNNYNGFGFHLDSRSCLACKACFVSLHLILCQIHAFSAHSPVEYAEDGFSVCVQVNRQILRFKRFPDISGERGLYLTGERINGEYSL